MLIMLEKYFKETKNFDFLTIRSKSLWFEMSSFLLSMSKNHANDHHWFSANTTFYNCSERRVELRKC
uniref:Uncharacterized protein n=1 Tax=Glossina palpalis gambiensis TaxID=67801 RepID=A0A1B0BH32_9MUSC